MSTETDPLSDEAAKKCAEQALYIGLGACAFITGWQECARRARPIQDDRLMLMGQLSMSREIVNELEAENKRLRERIDELEEFLVALKYADVSQFDRVKEDAAELLRKGNFHLRLIDKARAALEGK